MTAVRFARSFEGVGGIGSLRLIKKLMIVGNNQVVLKLELTHLCACMSDMDEAETDQPGEIWRELLV
jgi:hypothetical protein